MAVLTGLDISHHQGLVSWREAAKGHRFVFLKCTEGLTFKDKRYDYNRYEAREAGLYVGAYHYATPSVSAVAQADRFVALAGDVDLPHVLDLESGIGNQDRWALDFLHRVEDLTGRTPIFYSYAPHIKAHLSSSELARFPLWLAAYRVTPPTTPRPWKQWLFWQHTSSGSVAGIKGRVDLNRFAGTDAELAALCGREEDDMPLSDTDLMRIAAAVETNLRSTLADLKRSAENDSKFRAAVAEKLGLDPKEYIG